MQPRPLMRSARLPLACIVVVVHACSFSLPPPDTGDAGGRGDAASTDAGDTEAAVDIPDAADPRDALAADAAPLHCFGGAPCDEGAVCCMRPPPAYGSGYCEAFACSNSDLGTYRCDSAEYCVARGLGSVCCGTGDGAGSLTGSSCASSCGGQELCNPATPNACPGMLSCKPAVGPAVYSVCE
jgi:hypothetical protein